MTWKTGGQTDMTSLLCFSFMRFVQGLRKIHGRSQKIPAS